MTVLFKSPKSSYGIRFAPVVSPLSAGNAGGEAPQGGIVIPGDLIPGDDPGDPEPQAGQFRYYCGDVVYDMGTTRLLTGEGYVTFSSDGTPQYHYYLRDHLGNVRVVFDQTGTVEQVNHYYAFGGLMRESTNPGVQPYKYGGKELDRTSGLDAYDFGARSYFADRLQWSTMDPLCEKYYDVTPYGYCHNDPARLMDADGKDDWYNQKGEFLRKDGRESDNIVIQKWQISVDYENTSLMVMRGNYIKDTNLSAEAYSNIFTDILSKMPDVDLSKLKEKHISVVVWNGIDDGKLTTSNYYNNPDLNSRKLSSAGNTRITANINLINDNRNIFSTVSNIQNLLGIHEYQGHMLNHYGDESLTHHRIFEAQMEDPTWNKITDDLKAKIMENYIKYLRNEKE